MYQNVKEDVTATTVYPRFKAALLTVHEARFAVRNTPSQIAANDKSEPSQMQALKKNPLKNLRHTSGRVLFLTPEPTHTVVAESKTYLSAGPTCLHNII